MYMKHRSPLLLLLTFLLLLLTSELLLAQPNRHHLARVRRSHANKHSRHTHHRKGGGRGHRKNHHKATVAPTPGMSVNSNLFAQYGSKLTGTGFTGEVIDEASALAFSGDGLTALVGGKGDAEGAGAVWVFTRSSTGSNVWSQLDNKLLGRGNTGKAAQGTSVALDGQGLTAAVGGPTDNGGLGAVWIFVRSAGSSSWSQLGQKLVGDGYIMGDTNSYIYQGSSVALSDDGLTLVVGGSSDNNGIGAVWVFTFSNNVWTQQGPKLVGTGYVGEPAQGTSVSISADGNLIALGGPDDTTGATGAVWVFVRVNGLWYQKGKKLVGTGHVGTSFQGCSVSLSADATTMVVGARGDNLGLGAAWIFVRNTLTGDWTQQGEKLTGNGYVNKVGLVYQGYSVHISGDGNTFVMGGIDDENGIGASWVFTRNSPTTWAQLGSKLVGTNYQGSYIGQGTAVVITRDSNTVFVGGPLDNLIGAVWVFVR